MNIVLYEKKHSCKGPPPSLTCPLLSGPISFLYLGTKMDWLLRGLQRLEARRTLERRNLLNPGRSLDPDRSLAPTLQYRRAVQPTWLSTARPGSCATAIAALQFRLTPTSATHGAIGNYGLTSNTDLSASVG